MNQIAAVARVLVTILGYLETVKTLLRRGATLELDGRAPVDELASVIESLVLSERGGRHQN